MEIALKVLLLLCFIILPLIPARERKNGDDSKMEESQSKSNYGVSEDGYLTLIDNEENKRIKDKRDH
jgi:hypothetical protein